MIQFLDLEINHSKAKKMPKSIFKKLDSIMSKKRDKQKKEDENKRFLTALTKPYCELDCSDRVELYEGDCMIKRNLILDHQWAKMDTLWFQQNYKSHPYMKKPHRDVEIEEDIKKLCECLQPQHPPSRQVPAGSANLFGLNN